MNEHPQMNDHTQQNINKLRARLFNQAEHILREVHRDDFNAIYATLCGEAGIPYAPKNRELVREKYKQLIQTKKDRTGN